MSHVYTPAKKLLADGDLDLANSDIRVIGVMSNTTADTEQDMATIAGFTTLDEYDGSAYVRKTVAGEATSQDDPNNRAEFTFSAFTWSTLGAGTRQMVGVIIFKFVTNDTDSIPIAYVDSGGFPFSGNGGNVLYTPNAEGVIQLT